jgi:hypothetical protein
MGIFDILLKKKGNVENKNIVQSNSQKSLVSIKAKALIEELVLPLSKPNQKLIDEVLTIITQTANLPDSMVNKDEVQKITKKLLFELVEPISNPNKQLIDELVQLINLSGSEFSQKKDDLSQKNANENLVKEEIVTNHDEEDNNLQKSNKVIKGQAGLKQMQMQAVAQAPFPSEIQEKTKSKDRETKSIMNLLLEQIKELITITNGLNSKLKTHQVRIDAFDSSIKDLKKKTLDFDERMIAFEKNMEKFIGLYEVVTNQYNPFVETTDTFSDEFQEKNKGDLQKEIKNDLNNDLNNTDNNTEKNKSLIIANTQIDNLSTFSDTLIFMSEDDFKNEVIDKKELIFKWLDDNFKNNELINELSNLDLRNEWIKAIIIAQN